jgi:hypothetical protein
MKVTNREFNDRRMNKTIHINATKITISSLNKTIHINATKNFERITP